MIEIIAALDTWTAGEYPSIPKKLWGLTEIVHKTEKGSDQPIPVTCNNTSDRQQVALDDRYQLITWIRLQDQIFLQDEIDGENWAFGLSQGIVQRPTLRWVIAHRVELGEGWIFDFLRAIPTGLSVSGYQIVHVDRNGLNLNTDHEGIYLTELGRTVYEKHRFTWNIYVINLPIEFIKCGTVGDFITDENGQCLTA